MKTGVTASLEDLIQLTVLHCAGGAIASWPYVHGAGCAKAAMIGLAKLEACYKGEHGKQLDAQARNETNDLHPAHTFVPWVGLGALQTAVYLQSSQLVSDFPFF